MAAIPLCEFPLAELKKLLLDEFHEVKSSHISEALAASAGFRTNAALKASLLGPESDRPYVLLEPERFLSRLVDFGYPFDPNDHEFDFEPWYEAAGVVSTRNLTSLDIHYRTERELAWRNLVVCGVNAGLQQKLFTLRPGDDRFVDDMRSGHSFDFVLPNGLPARGSVADAGIDELAINVAVNPKGDAVRHADAGFSAGDAMAATWLERRDGVYIQTWLEPFRCRRALLPELAALQVAPMGYGDRAAVRL